MKKKVWMSVLTAALFVGGIASLRANSFDRVQANIPFGFTIGNEAFQPGVYTVDRVGNDAGTMVLRSSDGGQSVFFLTFGTDSPEAREKASLVFNRYGDQYFLKEVWAGRDLPGRQLVPSMSERELSLATSQNEPEFVVILAVQ